MKLGHSQANKIYWYKCHQNIYQNQVKKEGSFNTSSHLCLMKLLPFHSPFTGTLHFLGKHSFYLSVYAHCFSLTFAALERYVINSVESLITQNKSLLFAILIPQ